MRVDTWLLPIVRGDRFMLCSDGLVDEVDDYEIADHRSTSTPIRRPPPRRWSPRPTANGGRDNVTVIVVDVIDGHRAAARR